MEECVKGNKEALSLFYTRFAPRMLSLVRRFVSNPSDAKDILHDGFIVAFTRLKTVQDPDKVGYWLATIMKNLSLQFLQAQDVAADLDRIAEVEDAPNLEDIMDMETLEVLIRKLPPGYQKVFRLSVLENKSHKEISKVLGITPNTSSSQLFHAKIMMRRLIMEYRLEAGFAVILMVLTCGLMVWHSRVDDGDWSIAESEFVQTDMAAGHDAVPSVQPDQRIASASDIVASASASGVAHQGAVASPIATIVPAVPDDQQPDGVEDAARNESEQTATETGENALVGDERDDDNASQYDDLLPPIYDQYIDDYIAAAKSGASSWSVSAKISANLPSLKGKGGDLYMSGGDMSVDDPAHGAGDDDLDSGSDEPQSRVESAGARSYRDLDHHSDMPITASFVASKQLSRMLSVETGLSYSYLHTELRSGTAKRDAQWHYIGIPLRFSVENLVTNRFRLYATIGAQLDVPVYSSVSVGSGDFGGLSAGRFDSHVVWSVSASYGVCFRLSHNVGIIVEPSLRYNFSHRYDVPNAWTDNRWSFSLPIGLQLKF